MSRRRIALTAAGLALAGSLAAVPAATAASASPSTPSVGNVGTTANHCSGWKEIHITGGAAKYMECTRKVNGKSYASGAFYLWDTKHDGKAVQAYAETDYNHWYGDDVTWEHFYGWGNDTHGSPKIITGWHRGNDFGLRIYLR
ncbi:hypothetical protein IPZ61_09870 [Streptomyces sioyaensis]|uniref:hypothetical protein n=1 Tax=Streptomyces sioyaensis TaxID=67364 RepID=UPI001F26E835|nr:hypothetical protein [Streptomyces sioyaensis]MCF3173621.1 hypothetical protein [Streptomyces sioyaensis]